jgi:hypothetical protein
MWCRVVWLDISRNLPLNTILRDFNGAQNLATSFSHIYLTPLLSSLLCFPGERNPIDFRYELFYFLHISSKIPITLLICIWVMFGLNLSWDIDWLRFLSLPQSLQENARILSWIRPRPLPSTTFPIHHSLITLSFDAIYNLSYWRHCRTIDTVVPNGCIDPRFLDFGNGWRWLVNFTPRPLYVEERISGTHWIGDWL